VCGKYIERANPDHPTLIDEAHVMDELFGIVNVPSGVWIDEKGMIVRPPEPAWSREQSYGEIEVPEDATPEIAELIQLVNGLRIESRPYMAALRDWVDKGSDSEFALSPDEVIRRSRPQPPESALGAAHFEMGQHLHRAGHAEDAVAHFRQAHELQPDNWTYKRQAWSLIDRRQGPTEHYDGYWRKDVKETGPENYYPPFTP
jgi:hypothetical protein